MHAAKEILRRKAMIGLYSDLLGAMRHYAGHFGWGNASKGGRLTGGTLACFKSSILEGMEGRCTALLTRRGRAGGIDHVVQDHGEEQI